MQLVVRGFSADRLIAIQEAASNEWNFDGWRVHKDIDPCEMTTFGVDSLGGGEEESDFAQRLAEIVWEANGEKCHVEVVSIYLDDLPSERFTFAEEDNYEMV